MHPFLLPSEWLVTGRFLDPDGGETLTAGAAIVTATDQFPEILQVSVELRKVGDASYSQPQTTYYHLEIVAASQVKFRMDSIALGTILAGGGCFTRRTLTLTYLSPDRRYVGFGSFVADGTLVKTWEVQLERVPEGDRA